MIKELKKIRKEISKMNPYQAWQEGYEWGFSDALKKVEKLIDKWRVQLETGFISIDKRFVNELQQKISKLKEKKK